MRVPFFVLIKYAFLKCVLHKDKKEYVLLKYLFFVIFLKTEYAYFTYVFREYFGRNIRSIGILGISTPKMSTLIQYPHKII